MYFVGVKDLNNNVVIIPAINFKLKFDAERTIDEVEFKTFNALNYYSDLIVYLTPFPINLSVQNPLPAVFNFELPINESISPNFIQSFSAGLLTLDSTFRGKYLNTSLNILSSSFSVRNFCVYVTFDSTRSTTPLIQSDGTKFAVVWNRSEQRFEITYDGTTYNIPLVIDNNANKVFVNALIVVDSSTNRIYVYAVDYNENIVSNSVSATIVSLTFNSLTIGSGVYNFWFLNYVFNQDIISNSLAKLSKDEKSVLKTVYTFIVNRVNQINPKLFNIGGYSSGYIIHGTQIVNTEFTNTRVDLIMQNLIESNTNLTVLNLVDASTLPEINYIANGSLFIILNDLATKYNLTFFTLHNFVVLLNSIQINVGRTIDVAFNKPQIYKSDLDKYNKVINSGVTTEDTKVETFTGNGTNTTFTLKFKPLTTEVSVNGTPQELNVHYKVNDNKIVFNSPPANGTTISVKYTYNLMITASAENMTKANVNTKRNYLPYADYQTLVLIANQDLRESTRKSYQFILPMRFDLRPSEVYTIKFINYYDYHLHIYNENFVESVNDKMPAINGTVFAVLGYQYSNVDFVKRAYKLDANGQIRYDFESFDPSVNWLIRVIIKTEIYPSSSTTIMQFGNCSFVLNSDGTIDINVGSTTIATLPAITDWRVIVIKYVNGTYTVAQNSNIIVITTVSNITTVNSLIVNTPCIFDSFIWIKDYVETFGDIMQITSNNANLDLNVVYGTLRSFDFDGQKFVASFVDFDPNLLDLQQQIAKRLENLESLVLRQTNIQNSMSQLESLIISDVIEQIGNRNQSNSENVTVNDAHTPSNHRYDGGRTYQETIYDFTIL
jgi:hypothetical protein